MKGGVFMQLQRVTLVPSLLTSGTVIDWVFTYGLEDVESVFYRGVTNRVSWRRGWPVAILKVTGMFDKRRRGWINKDINVFTLDFRPGKHAVVPNQWLLQNTMILFDIPAQQVTGVILQKSMRAPVVHSLQGGRVSTVER
jgi:hypothetical protein